MSWLFFVMVKVHGFLILLWPPYFCWSNFAEGKGRLVKISSLFISTKSCPQSSTYLSDILRITVSILMYFSHLRVLSRSLSTSVARHQLVQPPVQVFGTEGRYATALFSAASKKKSLEVVEKDLKTFHATLKKDQRLADFLADPSIKRGLKAEGLASACDKLKMNELSKNLFLTLAENNRFSAAEAVVNSFDTIMAAHRGEVVCEVVTAKVFVHYNFCLMNWG